MRLCGTLHSLPDILNRKGVPRNPGNSSASASELKALLLLKRTSMGIVFERVGEHGMMSANMLLGVMSPSAVSSGIERCEEPYAPGGACECQ